MRVAVALMVATFAVGATPTPPPQIYRVVTRPLCAELHEHIRPAIGMMLENDTNIKKGPDLFSHYNEAGLYGDDAGAAGQKDPAPGDPGGNSNSSQNLALLGLENLIRPIANNIIAIQTILDTPALMNGTGRPEDDQHLQQIRKRLLQALAAQNASLDLISGFVDTQQMADLQHAGEAYISSISKPDTGTGGATPSPLNPLAENPNYAGLAPNPYTIDPATIPGLTMGYNPVTRLRDALRWTIEQTAARENEAAKDVMSSAELCSAVPAPAPSP